MVGTTLEPTFGIPPLGLHIWTGFGQVMIIYFRSPLHLALLRG